MSDVPEFRYTTLGKDEDAVRRRHGRVRMAARGVPAHWSVYFNVESADAALAKIGELGGSTVMPGGGHPLRPAGHRRRLDRRGLQAPAALS